MKPFIAIAVATHRSTIDMATARSIMGLQDHLTKSGYAWALIDIDNAEISWARNHLAARFLQNQQLTHLLFVDTDMTFTHQPVITMMAAKKEVIGCIYPKRFGGDPRTALEVVARAGRKHADDNAAIGEAAGFVVGTLDNRLQLQDGIAEVQHVGMGLCLIARSAFEKLQDSGTVVTRAGTADKNIQHTGFFDQILDPYKSEDAAFCQRWRKIGGKVYALPTKDVGHVARVEVRASPMMLG